MNAKKMTDKEQQYLLGQTLGMIAFEQGITWIMQDKAVMEMLKGGKPGQHTALIAGWTNANQQLVVNVK